MESRMAEGSERGGRHAVVVDTVAKDCEFIDICLGDESIEVCRRLPC
jgi:hypothetical protein